MHILLGIKKLGDEGEVVAHSGPWAVILIHRLQPQSSLNEPTVASVTSENRKSVRPSIPQASSINAKPPSLPILQSLTSVFNLPVKLQCTNGKTATAQQKAGRAKFVQAKYEELERSLGKPVTPAHEGEIFSNSTVRLIYDAPTLQADRFLVPLPADCLYSRGSAEVVIPRRDDFKFKQGIIQAQQGKVAKEAFYSHAFLVMVLESPETSTSAFDRTVTAMELDNPASSLPEKGHAAAPYTVKREGHSPKASKTSTTRPATPVSPVASRHPVCFPLDIKASYADSAHTKTNVEAFLQK
jgi:hypothetical protein